MEIAARSAGSLLDGDPGNGEAPREDAVRVLIVDDHPILREGTRRILGSAAGLEVVGEVERGDEVAGAVAELDPDVVLLDVRLPGMNGVDVARRMTSLGWRARVLILSAYADDGYVQAAFAAGAAGFLLKTTSPEELVNAVRAVHFGATVIDSALSQALLPRQRSSGHGIGIPSLTRRELDVLRLLGSGLRNKQIAIELGLSRRTVEGHLSRLFEKLGVSSRTELVVFAVEHRLIGSEPEG